TLLIPVNNFAQSKADRKVIKALRSDISYLGSDELEGRRTSTEGERKAGDYLIARYQQLGIPSRGTSYKHPYTFTYGKQVSDSNYIAIGGNTIKPPTA